MTQLNWSRSTFDRRPSDYCGDDLPPTGSLQDVIRYLGGRNDLRAEPRREARKASFGSREFKQPAQSTRSKAGADAVEELRLYVAHAQQPDFGRRAKVQRADTVRALVSLACRVRVQCGGSPEGEEALLLSQAAKLVARWRLS